MSLLITAIENNASPEQIEVLLRRGLVEFSIKDHKILNQALLYLIKHKTDEDYIIKIAALLIKQGANIYEDIEEKTGEEKNKTNIKGPIVVIAAHYKRFETVKWLLPQYSDTTSFQKALEQLGVGMKATRFARSEEIAEETAFDQALRLIQASGDEQNIIAAIPLLMQAIQEDPSDPAPLAYLESLARGEFPDFAEAAEQQTDEGDEEPTERQEEDTEQQEEDTERTEEQEQHEDANQEGQDEQLEEQGQLESTQSEKGATEYTEEQEQNENRTQDEQEVQHEEDAKHEQQTQNEKEDAEHTDQLTQPRDEDKQQEQSTARAEEERAESHLRVEPKDDASEASGATGAEKEQSAAGKDGDETEPKEIKKIIPEITAEMKSAANLAGAQFYAQALSPQERQKLILSAAHLKKTMVEVQPIDKKFDEQDEKLAACLQKVAKPDQTEEFHSLAAFSELLGFAKKSQDLKVLKQLLTDSKETNVKRDFLRTDKRVVDYLYNRLLADSSLAKNLFNILELLAQSGNYYADFIVLDFLRKKPPVFKTLYRDEKAEPKFYWLRKAILNGTPGAEESCAVHFVNATPTEKSYYSIGEIQIFCTAFFRAFVSPKNEWRRAELENIFTKYQKEKELLQSASHLAALTLYEMSPKEEKYAQFFALKETPEQRLWNKFFNAKCVLHGWDKEEKARPVDAFNSLSELVTEIDTYRPPKVAEIPWKVFFANFLSSFVKLELCFISYKNQDPPLYQQAYKFLEQVIDLQLRSSEKVTKNHGPEIVSIYEPAFFFLQQALQHLEIIIQNWENKLRDDTSNRKIKTFILTARKKQLEIYCYYARSAGNDAFLLKIKWLRQALKILNNTEGLKEFDQETYPRLLDDFVYLTLKEYKHENFAENLAVLMQVESITPAEQLDAIKRVQKSDRATKPMTPAILESIYYLRGQLHENLIVVEATVSADPEAKEQSTKPAPQTEAVEAYLQLIKTNDPVLLDDVTKRLTRLHESIKDNPKLLARVLEFLAKQNFAKFGTNHNKQFLLDAIMFANKLKKLADDNNLHANYVNEYVKHWLTNPDIAVLVDDAKDFSLKEDCLQTTHLTQTIANIYILRAKIYFKLTEEKEALESILKAYDTASDKETIIPELINILNQKSLATEKNQALLNKFRKVIVQHLLRKAQKEEKIDNIFTLLTQALDFAKQISNDDSLYIAILDKIVLAVLLAYGYQTFWEQLRMLLSTRGSAASQEQVAFKPQEILAALKRSKTETISPLDQKEIDSAKMNELLVNNYFVQATIYERLLEEKCEPQITSEHQEKAASCYLKAYATSLKEEASKTGQFDALRTKIFGRLKYYETIIKNEDILPKIRWRLIGIYFADFETTKNEESLLIAINLAGTKKLNVTDLHSTYLNTYIILLLSKNLEPDAVVATLRDAAREYEFTLDDCLKTKVLTDVPQENRAYILLIIAKIHYHGDKKQAAEYLLKSFNEWSVEDVATKTKIVQDLITLEEEFANQQTAPFTNIRQALITHLLANTPTKETSAQAIYIARRAPINQQLLQQAINVFVQHFSSEPNFVDLIAAEEKVVSLREVLTADCLQSSTPNAKALINVAKIFKRLQDFPAAAAKLILALNSKEADATASMKKADIIALFEQYIDEKSKLSDLLFDALFVFYCEQKDVDVNAILKLGAKAQEMSRLKSDTTLHAIYQVAEQAQAKGDHTAARKLFDLIKSDHPLTLFTLGELCQKTTVAKYVDAVAFYCKTIMVAIQTCATHAELIERCFEKIAACIPLLKAVEDEGEITPFTDLTNFLCGTKVDGANKQGLCENDLFLKDSTLVIRCLSFLIREMELRRNCFQCIVKHTQPKEASLSSAQSTGEPKADQKDLAVATPKGDWPAKAQYILAFLFKDQGDQNQTADFYRAAYDSANASLKKDIIESIVHYLKIDCKEKGVALKLLQCCFEYYESTQQYSRILDDFRVLLNTSWRIEWLQSVIEQLQTKLSSATTSTYLGTWLAKIRFELAKLFQESDIPKEAARFFRAAYDSADKQLRSEIYDVIYAYVKQIQNQKAVLELLQICFEYRNDRQEYDELIKDFNRLHTSLQIEWYQRVISPQTPKSIWLAKASFQLAKCYNYQKLIKAAALSYQAAFNAADAIIFKEQVLDEMKKLYTSSPSNTADFDLISATFLQMLFDYHHARQDYRSLLTDFESVNEKYRFAWYTKQLALEGSQSTTGKAEVSSPSDTPKYGLDAKDSPKDPWPAIVRFELAKLHKADAKLAAQFYCDAYAVADEKQQTEIIAAVDQFVRKMLSIKGEQDTKIINDLLSLCFEYYDKRKEYALRVNLFEAMRTVTDPKHFFIVAKAYHQLANLTFESYWRIRINGGIEPRKEKEALQLLAAAENLGYLPALVTHAEWYLTVEKDANDKSDLYVSALNKALEKLKENQQESLECILHIFKFFMLNTRKEEPGVAAILIKICQDLPLVNGLISSNISINKESLSWEPASATSGLAETTVKKKEAKDNTINGGVLLNDVLLCLVRFDSTAAAAVICCEALMTSEFPNSRVKEILLKVSPKKDLMGKINEGLSKFSGQSKSPHERAKELLARHFNTPAGASPQRDTDRDAKDAERSRFSVPETLRRLLSRNDSARNTRTQTEAAPTRPSARTGSTESLTDGSFAMASLARPARIVSTATPTAGSFPMVPLTPSPASSLESSAVGTVAMLPLPFSTAELAQVAATETARTEATPVAANASTSLATSTASAGTETGSYPAAVAEPEAPRIAASTLQPFDSIELPQNR